MADDHVRLSPATAATTGLLPDRAPEPAPPPDGEGGILDRLVSARAARRASRGTVSVSDPTGISRRAD